MNVRPHTITTCVLAECWLETIHVAEDLRETNAMEWQLDWLA